MGKRAVRRKLQSIKLTTSRIIIAVLAVIGAVVWWLVEQYAGTVAVNFIGNAFSRFLLSIFEWGREHPGQISIMIFFLSSSYLVGKIIQDTRPVKDIPVTVD